MNIIERLVALFRKEVKPSVDSALAHFNTALAELRTAKEHHDAEAQKHAELLAKAEADFKAAVAAAEALLQAASEAAAAGVELAESEAVRAARAIVKIEELVGL